MFKLSLSENELTNYIKNQLNQFFPDNQHVDEKLFKRSLDNALERSEYCFRHVAIRAFNNDGTTFFSHLHADQYTLFLWFLSNSVWREFEDDKLASKIFYLNKVLNGVTCMYDAQLPNIFLILHGNGVVLGKASYSDFFVCHHGCTVGAVYGVYPRLGKGVAMAPQSTIVGNCIIGDHVTIGTNSLLRNKEVSNHSTCYNDCDTGVAVVKPSKKFWAQSFFNVPIPFTGDET